jgi:hypothetical protein
MIHNMKPLYVSSMLKPKQQRSKKKFSLSNIRLAKNGHGGAKGKLENEHVVSIRIS